MQSSINILIWGIIRILFSQLYVGYVKSLVYCVKQRKKMLCLSFTTVPQYTFYYEQICYEVHKYQSILSCWEKAFQKNMVLVIGFRLFGEAGLASFSFIGNIDSYFEDKVKLPVCCSLTLFNWIIDTHTPGPTGWL